MKVDDTKVFGFWVYLMTDLVIFAALFATFIVLRNNTFDGPSAQELFTLPPVLAETLALLASSFTCSLVLVALHRNRKNWAIIGLVFTFALGLTFLVLEIQEFAAFTEEGASWQRSAFLSSYFALVGTHGLHISVGLIWILIAALTLAFRGFLESDMTRITMLSLFWHFLDIVWIFIFSVVYAMGIL